MSVVSIPEYKPHIGDDRAACVNVENNGAPHAGTENEPLVGDDTEVVPSVGAGGKWLIPTPKVVAGVPPLVVTGPRG